MKKICAVSDKEFEITDEDMKFYEKMGVPIPTLCPEERQRRRLAWRNERSLYSRKCDKCGKSIISIYEKNTAFPTYCSKCWWGDSWDAKQYAREFDFSRPFFVQFHELQKDTPKLALIFYKNENCDFTNLVGESRNCYLIFGSIQCEDCYYGSPYFSKDCVDTLSIRNSEFCYECLDSDNLYECLYCQNCMNSNNLILCYDVQGSHDCFACVGLRKAKYCILNKQYSEKKYKQLLSSLNFNKKDSYKEFFDQFIALKEQTPHKFQNGTLNENVTGDYLFETKNCHNSFNCKNCEDMNRVTQISKSKDIFDTDNGEYGELIYENSGFYRIHDCIFCYWNWDNSTKLAYCSNCSQNINNCFGCIGLRNSQYCILNKQYSKEEYFKLRDKIIEHMKETEEWGEFFPIELSPFAYNETVAQEYFPMTKEEALAREWKWRDEDQKDKGASSLAKIPDDITNVPDSICNEILACETCDKNYKIQKVELKFYRKMNLPIPHKCPDCRHADRMKLRNQRKLWTRKCDKCGVGLQTTFTPDRPEKIYCEKCYLDTVE